jgi:hypothetical protein
MNKKIIYSILMSLALLISGCENNFEPKIYGSLNSINFPKSASDYESYMMECYVPFSINWSYQLSTSATQHNFYAPEGGIYRLLDATTDYCAPWNINSWGGAWTLITTANFTDMKLYGRSSSGTSPNHFDKIKDITRFTKVLGDLQAATVLTDAKKKELTGEVRLLRGMMMYYLLHFYGPVPVILDPAMVDDVAAQNNMVRPTLDEMSKYIADDFEYAIANMKSTQAEKGRYTADYARFCLMRHYLNEGGHMAGYYQKAFDLYSTFTGVYSLFGAAGTDPDAFGNQFKVANKFNSEVIMSVSCSNTADGSGSKGNFNPISWYVIPNDASKYADVANTIPTPFVNQGPGWRQSLNVDTTYYNTYEANDYRRRLILTSYVKNDAARTLITKANIGVKWSGYILNKYPIETATAFQGTDFPLARWADVLLMYAEASARKGTGAPDAVAIGTVNQVRKRAGLANLLPTATASKDAFLDAILLERGHEFLYEGCRKVDLIRFNKYRSILTKKGKAPTSQYFPIPQYAVDQAAAAGKILTQIYERPDYGADN